MSISFVLLWWHIPIALIILGCIGMYFGSYSHLGAFGWPTSSFDGLGILSALLSMLGVVLLIGGWYRGLFI